MGAYLTLLVVTFTISSKSVSGAVALSAAGIVAVMAAVHHFRSDRLIYLLHGIIYIFVPYGVYISEQWLDTQSPFVTRGYSLIFVLMIIHFVLVSRLTRRKDGFKSTPLDFLILFLAAVPLMPGAALDFRLGLVATKIIIFYYGWEILMAELRGKYHTVMAVCIAAVIAVPVVRWVI